MNKFVKNHSCMNICGRATTGQYPPLKFEILKKFPGDPALRQATEAVSIRRNKPKWNGKEEWSNEPRKPKRPSMRRSNVRRVTSNNKR